MNALLKLSRLIDTLTEFIGKSAIWLVLLVVLISAANAIMRYTISLVVRGPQRCGPFSWFIAPFRGRPP